MFVIKRNGKKVIFNKSKIVNAINKALIEVDGDLYETDTSEEIAQEIYNSLQESKQNEITVEEIQDLVEKKLMKSDRPDVAKSYILYRENRSKDRIKNSKIIQAILKRTEAKEIENANANVDEKSFSGREKEASSDAQKIIALDYTLSPEISEAHKNMMIYQHDLEKTNFGIHNCLNIDFAKLFKEGFSTRNGDVRPPSTFSTACQQLAVIFQCQSQIQFGGCGSVHVDYDLAPFVKKSFEKHIKHYLTDVEDYSEDNATILINAYKPIELNNENLKLNLPKAYNYAQKQLDREIKQACEALYHNLNTLESRAGSQVPFTSVNLGRDISTEGRQVTKGIFNASLNGIGKHHLTSIFPISIFQYKAGCNANPEDVNYDLKQMALTSMSKRIYPNWVNCDWSQAHEDPNNPDTYFSTMGCRTMLGYDRFSNSYNRVGRGNLVPNTIILPHLGIKYGICLGEREQPDLIGFWNEFEETLKLAEKGLLERFNIMVVQSPEAAPFMYQNGTMMDGTQCSDSVYKALRHQTLAIGYIGIAEMCTALFGVNHAENKEVHEFALSVVKRINEFAKEASERNNLNFSCYATPKISDWEA